ncbi:cytochrome b [Hydrogenophaga sp.]|uniref:cytochrome b n=1 Tax=Hydrogenophaga sp. TaxID=1904254 RepID=UPI0025BE9C14|nr:cytochrome b [Hydrogenophaga sp.]
MQETHPLIYTRLARLLHAVQGLALAGMFAVGLYMVDLPFSPDRLKLYNWHKWAGVLVLSLALLRLLWRLTHRPPPLPASFARAMPAWQRLAHHATHAALYLLFFAVPLLGWAYSSATGFSIVLFGVLPLPDWVPVNESLADALKAAHRYAAYALAALVSLHVAAALKHHFIDRDGLLSRMGWKASSTDPSARTQESS